MNVLVMGAGGVGGYFGALLARAGHRVTVIARGAHLDALQTGGLRVETAIEDDFTVPVHALPAPEPGVTADLILFTVKSYDAEEGIARIHSAVGPDTQILTLLNGVDAGELLASRFGWNRVLDGVVYIESHVARPGVIAQVGGPRRVIFGRRGGNSAKEEELLATFRDAGWEAELAGNVLAALWAKLSFIGPFAAVNTLTGMRAIHLCSDESCARAVDSMVHEYITVANAQGAALPAETASATMERMRGFEGLSSMLRDRMGGKRLEVEALIGSVAKRGHELGIPTPVTELIRCMLAPMSAGGAQQLGA